MSANPGKIVTIYQFSKLFASAFTKAFTPRNITSSFRVTGVYPLNRRAIPIPGNYCQPCGALTPTAKVAETHGIDYLPFYTPSKPVVQRRVRFDSDDDLSIEPSETNSERCISFTTEEMEKFQCRYEEGYDLDIDERYNLWLQTIHPSSLTPSIPKASSILSLDSTFNDLGMSTDLSPIVPDDVDENTWFADGTDQSRVRDESHCASFASNLTTTGCRSALAEFLFFPTPPGAKMKLESPGKARVLTSSEHLEEMNRKEEEKCEKEEKKELKRKQREEKKAMNTAKTTRKLKGMFEFIVKKE